MRPIKSRDDFRKAVVEALAKRAAYICSNPGCRKPTLSPSMHPEKALFTGVASHITAAAAGGPRYDPSLTQKQRASAENGIFLCATCSVMIDKNGGLDFPAELLRRWKADHESWVASGLHKSVAYRPPKAALLDLHFDGGSILMEVVKGGLSDEAHGEGVKAKLSERIIRLDLQIVNKGGAPASDIDVFLEFVGPFSLYDERQLRRLWDIYPNNIFDNPEAFVSHLFGRPKGTAMQQVAQMFSDGLNFSIFKDLIAPQGARKGEGKARGARFQFNEGLATVHVSKLKQNLSHNIQSIFVVFHSYEDVASFDIPFRLNAQELPEDVRGRLSVIVRKSDETPSA
jgi:hypothetical protein